MLGANRTLKAFQPIICRPSSAHKLYASTLVVPFVALDAAYQVKICHYLFL